MKIDFSKMNEMWGQVDKSQEEKQEEKTEFEEVPDGNYVVFVDKVHWRTSRANNTYLSWQLRIMTGEHEGRCIFKKSMCTTPQNMKFLFEDISNCGSEPPEHDIEALDLEDICDRAVEVRKYTKEGDSGSFVNVYINKYLGHRDEVRSRIRIDGDVAPSTGVQPTTQERYDDEQIPF